MNIYDIHTDTTVVNSMATAGLVKHIRNPFHEHVFTNNFNSVENETPI